jgi:hypothetical protein
VAACYPGPPGDWLRITDGTAEVTAAIVLTPVLTGITANNNGGNGVLVVGPARIGLSPASRPPATSCSDSRCTSGLGVASGQRTRVRSASWKVICAVASGSSKCRRQVWPGQQ